MTVTYPTTHHPMPAPGPTTYRNDPGFQLSTLVTQLGELTGALQTKLGIGASAPAAGTVLRGTGAGTSAFGAIQQADIDTGAIWNSNIQNGQIVGYQKLYPGSVTTAELAANAATTISDVAPTGATASVYPTWATLGSIPFTAAGGRCRLEVSLILSHTVTNASIWVGYNLDGGADSQVAIVYMPPTGAYVLATFLADLGFPSAVAHTLNLRWMTASGMATSNTGARAFVIETKR